MLPDPFGHLTRREHLALDIDSVLGLLLHSFERGEQAVPQHFELQAVEDGVHLLAVPHLALETVRIGDR